MNKNTTVILLALLAAGCGMLEQEPEAPPLDPSRKISEQDCARPIETRGVGNLKCMDVAEAERRARIAEEERQARLKKEAAERERLAAIEAERRRLAELEAARKRAEEERLAAERRRLQEEADRKAREARELQERKEAEARAKALAEQEAREAAARECRRLEQERSDGRAALADWVAKYGKDAEFKDIAGQITAFLGRARKVKPCPPA